MQRKANKPRRALVIGLTGSIGMGKTTAARQLRAMGAKVCNADAIVHRLLASGGKAVAKVSEVFPAALKNGAIDRKALGAIVFQDKQKLKQLEHILHPLVVAQEEHFVRQSSAKGARLVVLDIPLLFETGAQARCDKVLVVSAPYFIQAQRVMSRPGMTPEKFRQVLLSQMPDRQKRRHADQVILTGLGRAFSYRQLKNTLSIHKDRP